MGSIDSNVLRHGTRPAVADISLRIAGETDLIIVNNVVAERRHPFPDGQLAIFFPGDDTFQRGYAAFIKRYYFKEYKFDPLAIGGKR